VPDCDQAVRVVALHLAASRQGIMGDVSDLIVVSGPPGAGKRQWQEPCRGSSTPAPWSPGGPSAALTAQADAKGALDTLFLGLGAVALLVGATGVANIMVISVLERRQEIGLRRALGAIRGQIRAQFPIEAILLSLVGGASGVIADAAATAIYAHGRGQAIVIPPGA
jgi:ABC-type antimicrobial peptide transport system permease subunit